MPSFRSRRRRSQGNFIPKSVRFGSRIELTSRVAKPKLLDDSRYDQSLRSCSDQYQDEPAMSIGDDSGTAYRDDARAELSSDSTVYDFLENRVGQLLEVVRRFEGTGIRVCALSINDAAECAFVRFLVSDADRGREISSGAVWR